MLGVVVLPETLDACRFWAEALDRPEYPCLRLMRRVSCEWRSANQWRVHVAFEGVLPFSELAQMCDFIFDVLTNGTNVGFFYTVRA
jgi:hypothetical protein